MTERDLDKLLEQHLAGFRQEIRQLRQESEILKNSVSQLENHIEAYYWAYETNQLEKETLTGAIRMVASEYFGVTQQEIRGAWQVGNGRGQGFALRNLSEQDRKLKYIRGWVTLLMRQCCFIEHETLKKVYPWCFGTTYTAAINKLNELYQNPNHPDRKIWLDLLRSVREKADAIQADSSTVTMELNRIV